MSNPSPEIFEANQFDKKNGVVYLTPANNEFEKLYLEVREKENRVLSDKEVRQLPKSNSNYQLAEEWKLREKTAQRFSTYLERNKFHVILDLGCGNGWFTNLLAQSNLASKVIGVDVNVTELEQATRVFGSDDVSFIYCDIFRDQLPFAEKFDLITLNASVQYFADFGKLLKRIAQFLKPNGEIHILDSPFYKKEEITNAKERTRTYFQSQGNERLSKFYFHHTFTDIQEFEVLYEPKKGIQKRFLKQAESPFLWLKYKKEDQLNSVNKGFSKIAEEYENLEENSSLIQYKRKIIRKHFIERIEKKAKILEINCGTGIDAVYFAKRDFSVIATDVSQGMLTILKQKIKDQKLQDNIGVEYRSYLELSHFNENQFDALYSNFGGLNCVNIESVKKVVKDAAILVKPEGVITLVIMPKITFFEWLTFLKGNKSAFRRLKKGGVIANVQGEKVRTYYHSSRAVKKMLKLDFTDIKVENIFTAGPLGGSYDFPQKRPKLFSFFTRIDRFCNKTAFLRGFGDYYIISATRKTEP